MGTIALLAVLFLIHQWQDIQ